VLLAAVAQDRVALEAAETDVVALQLQQGSRVFVLVIGRAYEVANPEERAGHVQQGIERSFAFTRQIVDRLVEGTPLAAVLPLLGGLSAEGMHKRYDIPYHPGAIKLYQDKKMWPPKS
jgi:hypothetical protein